ncbi:MAG: serine/threonine protein kinase, partial [Planctomycetia bacterium]|nr:serine/threonine protein kinase [Planctomycetia bacterium]
MSTSSPRPSSSVHWSGSATRQTGSPERATPTVAGTDVLLGAQVGKYRILRQLGQGGMGRVYEAEDAVLKRRVALKVLLETATDNEQATRRFLHEAQSIARLNHPNIVAIHEADERDGICFLVMELVQGQSAEARLRHDGPFPWREATRIMMAVCQGLAAAHAAGLIHRDIKPGNIMLAGEAVKLGDFGLAKAVEPVEPGAPALTGPGIVVGTPDYMSPEQCRSEPFDERTDLYSLGAAYYALLTGKTPFRGETSFQVMMAHCSHPPPDPRHCNPDIPVGCAAIVQRALAKQPAERYQHAVEMQLALEGLLHGPGGAALSKAKTHRTAPLQPRRAPRRRWPAALGALAVLGLAVLMLRPYWNRPAPAFPPPTSSAQANAASAVANTADFAAFDPAAIGEGGLVLPLGTAVSALAIAPNGKHLAVAAGEPTGG